MSDQHDPYAQDPYRRPGDDADAAPAPGGDAGASEQPPATAADDAPTTQTPTWTAAPEPAEEPTRVDPFSPASATASGAGQPVPTVEQPLTPAAPQAGSEGTAASVEAPAAYAPPTPPPAYGEAAPTTDAPASDPHGTTTFPAAAPTGGDGGGGDEPFGTPTPAPAPKKRRTAPALLAAALVLGLAGGVGGAAAYDGLNGNDSSDDSSVQGTSLDKNASDTTDLPSGTIENVASKILPSVVQINVAGSSEAGSGSGVVISEDGDILTNNHVVEAAGDGGSINVSFSDGTRAKATVVGTDPVTDLAVIKAEKTGLTPATFGSSADLKVGQEVVAIGSPFGLESTVTSGIVSSLNRPVSSSDGSGSDSTVFPAVQTDAAINPGNSGGPLVDLDGRVIGINSAIRSTGSSSGESGSVGLGFAIPIDLARNVGEHLVKGEKVEHARIGVTVRPATESDQITGIGAQVQEVEQGSAGEKAGLKKGDIITAVNGQAVASSDALVATIRGFQPGEQVKLTYSRDDKTATTDVTLDSDGGSLGS